MKKVSKTISMLEDTNGYKVWHRNSDGKRHNIEGPAVMCPDGSYEYWIEGKLHNLNGPAVVRADGSMEYFVGGRSVTEAGYLKAVKRYIEKYGEAVKAEYGKLV
jgi:hypothetical protein